MRVHYCDHHVVELPPGHRFPMGKYAMLRRALVDRGVLPAERLVPASPAPLERVAAVHDPAYVQAFVSGRLDPRAMRQVGLPWSQALVARTLASAGGTLAAARDALAGRFAGNLAGGTHHAHRDRGAGFCVFNDLAIAARALLDDGLVRRALVLDLDVHQGDGTAAIFADEPRVFTVSLHGERNFPFRKPPSDLDVPLPDGCDDAAYLAAVRRALAYALDASTPDVVFFQGGVDGLALDRLGRLALTHEGLRARDRLVFEAAADAGIPLVATLGGGYAEPIEATVDAHVGTYREAVAVYG